MTQHYTAQITRCTLRRHGITTTGYIISKLDLESCFSFIGSCRNAALQLASVHKLFPMACMPPDRLSLFKHAHKPGTHTYALTYHANLPSSLIEKFLVKNQKPNQIEYKLILSNYLCTTIANANTQNYKIIQLCRQLP